MQTFIIFQIYIYLIWPSDNSGSLVLNFLSNIFPRKCYGVKRDVQSYGPLKHWWGYKWKKQVLCYFGKVIYMYLWSYTSYEYIAAWFYQGTKKSEPKPMTDNPNAAAIKTSSIIKPRPLKLPDSESLPVTGKSMWLMLYAVLFLPEV